MILHRLAVAGFRCFTSEVDVRFDPERINIVHGRNGSGKSSLFWALVRGLFDTYRAGGKGAEALRPWGTDLAPAIQIEFEDNGKIYRLTKKFLENRSAQLEVKQGKKFEPLAHNEKAEERVREMILAEQPTAGLTKPEKWGLARVLWCPQEQVAIEGFDGRVLGGIQELLGRQALDGDALAVKRAVESVYLEYWTESGRPRGGKGAPLWKLRQGELEQRQEELSTWKAAWDELQKAQQTARVLEEEHHGFKVRLDRARQNAARLQEQVNQYGPLASLCERLKAQWKGKLSEAKALQGAVERIAELREKGERCAKRLAELETEISNARREEDERNRALEEANLRIEGLRHGDPAVASLEQILADAEKYSRCRGELDDLRVRIRDVEGAQQRIAQWKGQAISLRAPSPGELDETERLHARRVQLEAQLDSALLHVELRPSEGRQVEVLRGEPSGRIRVGAGESLKVSGSPAIALELEGFGRLTVAGPAQSATHLKKELGEVARRIEELASRFGTSDIAELRQRRQELRNLELQSDAEARRIRSVLGNRTPASLQADAERLENQAAGVEALRPDWRETPPDLEGLKRQLAEARETSDKYRSEVTAEWQRRQGELADARAKRARLEHELEQLKEQAADVERELSKLRSDGLSDTERNERFKQLSIEAVGLEERFKQESTALQMFGPDPRPALEAAQREQDHAERAFQEADRKLHEHRGTLKGMLDRAPYEQCARLEEEIRELQAEIERDRLRADALKMLWETINQCEEEATAGIAGPVAERASKLLRRISGERIGSIRVSESLAPWAVEPREIGGAVELEVLSGGEREQVHLAVRLALTELLTKDAGSRHLAVLDDVVTATDDERLGRIFAVLEQMRTHAQFVILTCHPERYRSLSSAFHIDMESLRHGS